MRARIAAAGVISVVAGCAVTVNVAAAQPAPAAHQSPRSLAAAPTPNGSWTIYHRDNAHTGYDPTAPAVAGATAGWVSPTLDGQVYGEALVYNGIVYVATLQNTVYALDQSTG